MIKLCISWKKNNHPNCTTKNETNSSNEEVKFKLYKRRWFMVILYVLYNATNNFQWTQFVAIANILIRYYDVSSLTIEGTTITVSAVTIFCSFLVCYIIKRIGIRNSVILSALGTTIAAWIKWAAVEPSRILLLYAGQLIMAFSEIFTEILPSQVAARWFSAQEVSTATSIAKVGTVIGMGLSFVIVPSVVKNDPDITIVHYQFYYLSLGIAVFATAVTLAVTIFFEEQPAVPPSEARDLQIKNKDGQKSIWKSLKDLFRNCYFILLLTVYGLDVACLNAFTSYLNPIILIHFQNGEQDAGYIGMMIFFIGSIFAVLLGIFVDKKKNYKFTLIILKLIFIIGYALVFLFLYMEILWAVYISTVIMGSCLYSIVPIGFEFCAEITYPELNVPIMLMNLAVHIFSTTFLVVLNSILITYGELYFHVYILIVSVVSFCIFLFVKDERKRLNAKTLSQEQRCS